MTHSITSSLIKHQGTPGVSSGHHTQPRDSQAPRDPLSQGQHSLRLSPGVVTGQFGVSCVGSDVTMKKK